MGDFFQHTERSTTTRRISKKKVVALGTRRCGAERVQKGTVLRGGEKKRRIGMKLGGRMMEVVALLFLLAACCANAGEGA